MKLVGAKEFLKLAKAGTFFIQFWETEEECYDIIKKYESDNFSIETLNHNHCWENCIFCDNSGSLSFSLFVENGEVNDDEVIKIGNKTFFGTYYDLNIIGDADPTETLYLIFDDEEDFYNFTLKNNEKSGNLTIDDLKALKRWFMKNCDKPNENNNKWALEWCENSDWLKNDYIANYK